MTTGAVALAVVKAFWVALFHVNTHTLPHYHTYHTHTLPHYFDGSNQSSEVEKFYQNFKCTSGKPQGIAEGAF